LPATFFSVEKASTGTPRSRAIGATADTDGPNSGPTMTSAPCASSCWAASAALAPPLPSSAVISRILRLPASNIASSAAFIIEAARARVGAELLVKGRMMPTRTGVAPSARPGRRR